MASMPLEQTISPCFRSLGCQTGEGAGLTISDANILNLMGQRPSESQAKWASLRL